VLLLTLKPAIMKKQLLFLFFGFFLFTNVSAQFQFTVRTTTNNEVIYARMVGTNYTIDWGDGIVNSNTFSHIYAIPGDYQISVTGTFTGMNGGQPSEQAKIRSIDQWVMQLGMMMICRMRLKDV
jgi:hypothetical protein